MKIIVVLISILFTTAVCSSNSYKSIKIIDATITIPMKWNYKKHGNCFFVVEDIKLASYLEVCRGDSTAESNYFAKNDDGVWEAVTDGVPILAERNVTNEFSGMSALVLCKYKDGAGYHTNECFQGEIKLPTNVSFIFKGIGGPSSLKEFKKIYLSFKVKQ